MGKTVLEQIVSFCEENGVPPYHELVLYADEHKPSWSRFIEGRNGVLLLAAMRARGHWEWISDEDISDGIGFVYERYGNKAANDLALRVAEVESEYAREGM